MTVANSAFRPTSDTPLVPIFFTLRVDGVSQEILETFDITLMLNSGTAPPELFYPNTSVSIMDRDGELFCLTLFQVRKHVLSMGGKKKFKNPSKKKSLNLDLNLDHKKCYESVRVVNFYLV